MTRHLLLCSLLVFSTSFAEDTHGGNATTTPRRTMPAEEYIKQKEREYLKLDGELKKHEGVLEYWQNQLAEAKRTGTTAGIIGNANLVMIPATYYFGGKFLKWIKPAAPAKKFLSVAYARQWLSAHPKFVGSVVIAAEAGAGISGTYYYWVLSKDEIEELSEKVGAAKAETDKARKKVDKALAELQGRKPDTTRPEGDRPDMLDGNE